MSQITQEQDLCRAEHTDARRASENAPECPAPADRLNERQRAAIELLVLGKSYTAVAKAIEIDRKTLYRWRRDDEFDGAFQRRRAELWSEASERLGALVHPALDVMEGLLNDRYDRARFRAAAAVLRLANLAKRLEGSNRRRQKSTRLHHRGTEITEKEILF